MLILSRKVNEKIMVGDDVVITVVETRGGKVRIGVDAPDSVAVHREEVFNALKDAREGGAR